MLWRLKKLTLRAKDRAFGPRKELRLLANRLNLCTSGARSDLSNAQEAQSQQHLRLSRRSVRVG